MLRTPRTGCTVADISPPALNPQETIVKTLTVGTQFQHNQARPWTDTQGGKHFHSIVTLDEVCAISNGVTRFVTVKVVEEVGRPTEGDIMTPTPGKTKGSISAIGLAAAIKRGSIVPLAADHIFGEMIR